MTVFNQYIYTILILLLIDNTISQTPTLSIVCNGDPATQFCVCYLNSYECKTAIFEYERADCFYHTKHGCISITNPPTTNPTLNPTQILTKPPELTYINIHNQATNIPIVPISTLHCGDKISGFTKFSNDINWYALNINLNVNTLTDLLIDSCGSSYDTWLYFQHNTSSNIGAITDCDDCGYCSLQSQLQISNVNQGIYMVGIGGYRDDFGPYIIAITCTTTTVSLSPTLYPTDIPTPNPTPKPTNSPTNSPTNIATIKPSTQPSTQPSVYDHDHEPTYLYTELSTHNPDMEFFSNNRDKINGFEFALIFAVVLIILMIGCMFGVKFNNTKIKQHHLNISVVENENENEDEDEIISYVHAYGKTNCVNIDEILERATTDLINLVTDENNPFVE